MASPKPFKLEPLDKVASVRVARSLTSPALTPRVVAAPFLSTSYRHLRDAFILNRERVDDAREKEGEGER